MIPLDFEDPFEPKKTQVNVPPPEMVEPTTGLPKFNVALDFEDPFVTPKPTAMPKPTAAIPSREQASVIGELGKGVARGAIGFGEMAGGLAALAGAEETGKKIIAETQEIAKPYEPAIPSYKDIESIRDALLYAAHGLGTIIPTMALSLASGGIGGFIGKPSAQRAIVSKLGTEGVKAVGQKAIREAALRSAATKLGFGAGAFAGSFGMEAGQIGQTQLQEGNIDPYKAFAYATPAALLDVFPEWVLAKRMGFFGAAKKAGTFLTRTLKGMAQQFAIEAPTEGMQSVLEQMGAGHRPFRKDGLDDVVNSFLIGGLGGLFFGGVGGAFTRTAPSDKAPQMRDKTTQERQERAESSLVLPPREALPVYAQGGTVIEYPYGGFGVPPSEARTAFPVDMDEMLAGFFGGVGPQQVIREAVDYGPTVFKGIIPHDA